jgi:hypothetical protein
VPALLDLDGHRPAKVEAMETFVRRSAHQLLPGVTAISCGSYRRGKPDSVRRLAATAHPGAPKCTPQGDCDVIITHKDPRVQDRLLNLLPELVQCARCCVMGLAAFLTTARTRAQKSEGCGLPCGGSDTAAPFRGGP